MSAKSEIDLAAKSPDRIVHWSHDKQLSKRKTDVEMARCRDDKQTATEIQTDSNRDSQTDSYLYSQTDNCQDYRQIAPEIQRQIAPDDEQAGTDSDYSSDVSTFKRRQRIRITEDEWKDSITGNSPRFSSDASIFRVRMFLKDIKREAYVPKRVSLGPYHQGRPELPRMNHHKGRAVRRMMIRRNKNMNGHPDYMEFASDAKNAILNLRDKINNIYQEPIRCDENTLVWMLCWDGCFILEVLRTLGRDSNDPNDPNEKNDPIFGRNKAAASNLLKDILMLENQIPWIVLLALVRLEHDKDKDVERTLLKVVVEGTCGLFKFSEEDKSALIQCDWLITGQPVHHLLGFLHKVIVHRPSNQVRPRDQAGNCHCLIMRQGTNKASNDIESIPSAVELKHGGIKFLPFKGGIKEIYFDGNSATIYLPPVSITYGTEVLFRNLIAFEICRPSEGNYVTWYVALMNDLIDSEEDVALLRSVGILTNLLGSDKEVADLFNGLCNEGAVSIENDFYDLRKTLRTVNAHYRNKIRIQFEEFVQEHFSSPWKALAWAAASLILILALIQTIFTIIKK